MAEALQSLPGIKRGDSFNFTWKLPLDFANLVDSIESQVNDSAGTEIEDLTVTLIGDDDTYRIWNFSATDEQTALWPLKTLRFDIKHNAIDGKTIRSETLLLPVKKSETP